MSRKEFSLVFVLVLLLRLSIAAHLIATYDVVSYFTAADAVLSGKNVYAATARYNYSPAWSYVLALLLKISGPDILLFGVVVGLFLNAVDGAIVWSLIRISRDDLGLTPERARLRAVLFFANPVSIWTSCYLRQFDGFSTLLLLLAIVQARRAEERSRSARIATSAALAGSLLIKHITAFHPLLFARPVRRTGPPFAWVLVPYAVFLASFLPFLSASRAILDNVLLYGTWLTGSKGQRPWGIQDLAHRPLPAIAMLVFACGLAVSIVAGRGQSLTRASLLLFLALLAFAPGFAPQYFVWPIALASMVPSAGYFVYTLLAAAFMVSDARAWTAIPIPSLVPWLAVTSWFLLEIVRTRRGRGRGKVTAEGVVGDSPALRASG
jgi:hypothetical protein